MFNADVTTPLHPGTLATINDLLSANPTLLQKVNNYLQSYHDELLCSDIPDAVAQKNLPALASHTHTAMRLGELLTALQQ